MGLKTLDYNDPGLPSRDEIKTAMLGRLPEVLRHLYPNGRQLKREFQIGSLQGEKGQSLKVSMSGDKAGLWQDFESGHGGDIFDLWAAVHGLDTQRDFAAVLRSCADWLGVSQVAPPVSLERREWISAFVLIQGLKHRAEILVYLHLPSGFLAVRLGVYGVTVCEQMSLSPPLPKGRGRGIQIHAPHPGRSGFDAE